jgi:hypothetical protein
MEAVRIPETSVYYNKATRRNIPEVSKLQNSSTLQNINLLTLFKEITPVYIENHTEPINAKCRVIGR